MSRVYMYIHIQYIHIYRDISVHVYIYICIRIHICIRIYLHLCLSYALLQETWNARGWGSDDKGRGLRVLPSHGKTLHMQV